MEREKFIQADKEGITLFNFEMFYPFDMKGEFG